MRRSVVQGLFALWLVGVALTTLVLSLYVRSRVLIAERKLDDKLLEATLNCEAFKTSVDDEADGTSWCRMQGSMESQWCSPNKRIWFGHFWSGSVPKSRFFSDSRVVRSKLIILVEAKFFYDFFWIFFFDFLTFFFFDFFIFGFSYFFCHLISFQNNETCLFLRDKQPH